ncbi:MAG: molybdopterin-dependent oxidoreductase [Gammaproteobacteria bacterium]|nr:molybdopterin-dependent oxidoreductase [Gammaproteobacteria bacterium]
MGNDSPTNTRHVSTYCYQCVAGPDLLTVKVEDDVATQVEPNFAAEEVHPASGKVCVKAYGLIQKTYNPHRVKTPMKRTNPDKGKDQDPGFVAISWDEALDTIAERLEKIRGDGLRDESGYPRLAASFGGGGTPTSYMGTFPAFLGAWGPTDMGFGSGQGVKCYHSEHLYGELWHRAFTVCPDTPLSEYIISFGANVEASGGVCGVKRHADARIRGARRIQVEPHLSITGACSEEWVPIKPKTDAAFLFAMIHVLLHEHPREKLDLEFIKHRTTSPYLIGNFGFFMRDPESRKPLVWDANTNKAVAFDTPGIDPVLEAAFLVEKAVEEDADGKVWEHFDQRCFSSFEKLVAHFKQYTPLWASKICGVPAETIRRIAIDYLQHARVGETIEIEGRRLPLRPVAIMLGKTVNNGWGGFDCCWARTMLACLIGGLEVPGGTLGTTVRLNRPANSRQASVISTRDGIMDYPMNPTDEENWVSRPEVRNANRTLVPLVANSPWSQALGPTHLAWMMQDQTPQNWPKPTMPDLWFVYRTNPVISFWDTDSIAKTISRFPFTVCFSYTHDETNHMADILLPECTDLEGLQLMRIGGTKYVEQFWKHQGFALRQPVVKAPDGTRDMSWIATELARRTGLLEAYNKAINRGAAGVSLSGDNFDFNLDETKAHSVEEIWDASCRAASAELTNGEETQGLDYYREHGYRMTPMSQLDWYLYPSLEDQNIRFELPYQERLHRHGKELANRLHSRGISWWDHQLEEYDPLPEWKDYPGIWEQALEKNFNIDIKDYPFWLLTSRSMQYAWGGNADIQMIREVSRNIGGHGGVVMNSGKAAELGIEDGDLVEISSPLASTSGMAILRQGIRPDTLLMIGQFGHWATPLAKTFNTPSINKLVPMLLDLTDSSGSSSDLVKVSIKHIRTPS